MVELFTFIFIIIHSLPIHLAVRVRGFPVLDVITIQVGELRQQLEHALSVVVQVCHFTVEQVQTLQVIQFFLLITCSEVLWWETCAELLWFLVLRVLHANAGWYVASCFIIKRLTQSFCLIAQLYWLQFCKAELFCSNARSEDFLINVLK